jgi:mono/diheme cytochrome c family protein
MPEHVHGHGHSADAHARTVTTPPNEPVRQEVVSAAGVRAAIVLGTIGMVLTVTVLLLLTTARPQGRFVALDDSQHRAALLAAEERLSGFTADEGGAARLDIDHAMQLVAERGVDLPLIAGGVAPAAPAEAVTDPEAVAPVAVEGAPIFGANCAACHQATGAGIPGAFPPLADHAYELYLADRDYLPLVILYGLQGPITVNGVTYNGLMPPFPRLADDEIAGLLNYVMEAWGDAERVGDDYEPFSAEDVEALRGRGLSPTDVHAFRQEIGLP